MRTALLALAICVPCIQALALLTFIWTQTPLVPWGDEWAMVPLLQHADAGTFSFADLWALHNRSHRIVLPRLTNLLLIDATHWNRQVLMTFDLGVALIAGALIFACVYATLRKRRMAMLLVAPLSLLYLSFAQYENWILPWQLTFIATILGVSLCSMASADATRWIPRQAARCLGGASSSRSPERWSPRSPASADSSCGWRSSRARPVADAYARRCGAPALWR